MMPSRADLKTALWPMIRGNMPGSLCAMIPGTEPTIVSFVFYAMEKKLSKTPERFDHGAIEGVARPEASTHSAVQGDFITTMSLGIAGRSREEAIYTQYAWVWLCEAALRQLSFTPGQEPDKKRLSGVEMEQRLTYNQDASGTG